MGRRSSNFKRTWKRAKEIRQGIPLNMSEEARTQQAIIAAVEQAVKDSRRARRRSVFKRNT
ncbi:MAG TPA: hypothetical protein QF409_12515 [Acidimicrobiales bacterium]|nr:hypothetical protein [Acidimicrobiales bacterium]